MIIQEGTVTITKDSILVTGFHLEGCSNPGGVQREIYDWIEKRIVQTKLEEGCPLPQARLVFESVE